MRKVFWLALILALIAAGCRQETGAISSSDANITINLSVDPDPPVTGETTLTITLTDGSGNPVIGAALEARGDMNHAGMVPVIRQVEDGADDGEYTVPFEWTMGGDWVVTVTATLDDGRTVSKEFDLSVATGNGMATMNMDSTPGE